MTDKTAKDSSKHSLFDDAQGIVTSVALVSLAMAMFIHLGLVTGGIAGLSLVVTYATGLPLGAVLFLLNLPFYALALMRMGVAFTLKTILSVVLLSVAIELMPQWISFDHMEPLYGALLGGSLVGVGFIALFRHRASLGGFGILVLFLQDRMGWRAGWTQMALDCCVFLLASFFVDLPTLAYSFVGTVLLNLILAINHRDGRYFGG